LFSLVEPVTLRVLPGRTATEPVCAQRESLYLLFIPFSPFKFVLLRLGLRNANFYEPPFCEFNNLSRRQPVQIDSFSKDWHKKSNRTDRTTESELTHCGCLYFLYRLSLLLLTHRTETTLRHKRIIAFLVLGVNMQ